MALKGSQINIFYLRKFKFDTASPYVILKLNSTIYFAAKVIPFLRSGEWHNTY